ncbi:MAG: aminotransferase class IV [bacterium]
MKEYCYLNGQILPTNQARISVNDLGVLRGYGVFDFLRTYHGQPFLFKEHLARLANSAKLINLKIPLSAKQISAVISQLLKKNKLKEATIKIVLTGGPSDDGISYQGRPTFFILARKLKPWPAEIYSRGGKLITGECQRPLFDAKTTNYLNLFTLGDKKKKQNATEILYVCQGKVLEGATSNFFIFQGKKLITPKNNILIGMTRNLILKLSKKDFIVQERDIKIKDLTKADEAFVAATTREIMPIVKIDSQKIGTGQVGPNTKRLMALFRQHTDKL